MTAGDIVNTKVPVAELRYSAIKTGVTLTPGDAVGFDATGKMIKAIAATGGPIKILTSFVKEEDPSEAYMMSGNVIGTAGGPIVPNKYVVANADSELVQRTNETIDKIVGIFIKLPSDDEGDATAAADEDEIVVRVTA